MTTLNLPKGNAYLGKKATNKQLGQVRFATPHELAIAAPGVVLSPASLAAGIVQHATTVTDPSGEAILVAGTKTIANTTIKTTDKIFIQRRAANASTTLGELSYTISAGTSFTINSLILGTPASVQTADLSTVEYLIIHTV